MRDKLQAVLNRVMVLSIMGFGVPAVIEKLIAAVERIKFDAQTGRMMADERAVANSANRVVGLVVALTVGAIISAFLLPIGIDELVSVDTADWGDGAESLWEILDVIIVLALFLFFIAVALAAAENTG